MTLIEILNKYQFDTDKHTAHRYVQDIYEKEFLPYKDKFTLSLLEIGVLHGESLKLWRKYFPSAYIVGIDTFERIHMQTVFHNLVSYDVRIYDVDSYSDRNITKRLARKDFIKSHITSGFDIIIDDGDHTGTAQYRTFINFSTLIKKGGLYIIEDISPQPKHYEIVEQIPGIEIYEAPGKIGIIRF